jgi:ribosomal protein L7/L12
LAYKGLILERFEMLVKLCEETEPDINPSIKQLFTGQLIAAKEMYDRIETGVSVSENEIPQLMKQANKIWRIRNKVKNGEWDHLKYVEMTEQIEDYVAQGKKINAIKYYRQEMGDQFDEQVTLREAKEHIDKIADDMRLRGIVK